MQPLSDKYTYQMLSCSSFYANFNYGLPLCVLIWASWTSKTLQWDKSVVAQDQCNCKITSHFFESAFLSYESSVDYSETTSISSFNRLPLAWSSNREFVDRKLAVWSPRRRFFTTSKSVWCTGWMKTMGEYLIFFDDSIQTTVVNFLTKSLLMVWETWVRIWTST